MCPKHLAGELIEAFSLLVGLIFLPRQGGHKHGVHPCLLVHSPGLGDTHVGVSAEARCGPSLSS